MSANVDPVFWQDKRVLLTGHTGFKGGWLALWLQSMGAQVFGIALAPSTTPSLFDVARIGAGVQHHLIDIRDATAIATVFAQFRPEIVFHLAAQPLVRGSYQDPIGTYATNVMGTVHVLEAVRHADSVRAIVSVTSDKCYDNREWVWGYRESDPMGGHDPYSSSKGCAELVSSAYRDAFLRATGIALATARAGNVIGGGDWAEDRLVPDVLRALGDGHAVEIRSPHAIRPWQHVLEPLGGYLLLGQRLFEHGDRYAQGWNFGPHEDDARPVQWVVERLCAAWGSDATWTMQAGTHPHEAGFLKLDISKARQHLHWRPRWTLEQALSRVVRWQRAWLAGKDMRAVCLQHISEYLADV
ncbi:CDP-glucose 4,6-dehydratase [Thermomonas sp.]|uniref:CDP-glucose 4,6-dehydratase n=1 Tax=Thermomonas sp. TaxID=1971895 RepID=UPI0035B0E843